MSSSERRERIKSALAEAVLGQLSVRSIAKKWGIKSSTLHYNQTHNVSPTKSNQYLTHTEEEIVIKDCLTASKRGFPFNRKYVENAIMAVIREKECPKITQTNRSRRMPLQDLTNTQLL